MASSPVDLTTVAAVKAFLPAANSTADDAEIQTLITACSQYATDWCGRAAFTPVAQYTEIRNGNGSDTIFTKNDPITAIDSVMVDGSSVPIATGYNTGGAMVSENADAIVIVPSISGVVQTEVLGWHGAMYFNRGRLNVQLVYHAGYAAVPADLGEAITRLVAQQYQRRTTIDQKSKLTGTSGGNVRVDYQSWFAEPWVARVMWKYRRVALVS